MEKGEKRRGNGAIFILIAILIMIAVWVSTLSFGKESVSRGQLEQSLEADEVISVVIEQKHASEGGSRVLLKTSPLA